MRSVLIVLLGLIFHASSLISQEEFNIPLFFDLSYGSFEAFEEIDANNENHRYFEIYRMAFLDYKREGLDLYILLKFLRNENSDDKQAVVADFKIYDSGKVVGSSAMPINEGLSVVLKSIIDQSEVFSLPMYQQFVHIGECGTFAILERRSEGDLQVVLRYAGRSAPVRHLMNDLVSLLSVDQTLEGVVPQQSLPEIQPIGQP